MTDNLNCYFENNNEVNVKIINVTGKILFSKNIKPGHNVIGINDLTSGFYLLEIKINDITYFHKFQNYLLMVKIFLIVFFLFNLSVFSQVNQIKKAEVIKSNDGFRLVKDNKPYIKGAGGWHLDLLSKIGGNSIRTQNRKCY